VATSRASGVRVRFDRFQVDLSSGDLKTSDGFSVRLQQQPLQVLRLLLENEGKVVSREQLRAALWPDETFVDFEHGVNTAVRRLRQALEDSGDNPRFIETLPKVGYRFIAPVERQPDAGDSYGLHSVVAITRGPTAVPQPRTADRKWKLIFPVAAIIVAALSILTLERWRHSTQGGEVVERQLTANSRENSVTSAAVSPDGKYLTYADATGIYLKVIRTGETHAVTLPPDFAARVDDWFPDSSNILISRLEGAEKASLWRISVFGGSPHKLADGASGGSLSPDGAHIAFRRSGLTYDGLWGREEWVMRSDGSDQIKVAASKPDGSQVGVPTWSPDGKRIAYIRSTWAWNARTSSVEIAGWETGAFETLFSDHRLSPALHWLSDGRLIYAFGSAQRQQDSSLWSVSLRESGSIPSRSRRIAAGHGWISQVTGSADGKVIIFLSGNWLPSVYIGALSADHTQLLAHRRLTLDENEDVPSAWTTDSTAVLFFSNRNGTQEIFEQAIDQPVAERLLSSADNVSQPRVTPDGSELLYISTPRTGDPDALSSILAIPMGGGTPRLVLKDRRIWNLHCAQLPSTMCLYSVTKGNTSETFRFDVKTGKTIGLPQIDPDCNWSLSPDGSQRAIIVYGANDGRIHLRSTSTGNTREVFVRGWSGLMGVGWLPDGQSLVVSWHNFDQESALLRVTLDGKASVLLTSHNSELWGGMPSPDGRLLAIAEAGGPKNVWQIENF
jgi:DNA-binding winged helix-turn-helix (wHTH) protein/Tol biopolymer transport system component